MNSILNKEKNFGIFWEECFSVDNWHYGKVKILIGDKTYPPNNDEYDNYTLNTIFPNLKNSFTDKYYPGGDTNEDFGENDFNAIKWGNREIPNVLSIEVSELGGFVYINTLGLCLAYSGDTERLFYSIDNEDSFSEIRFPRGTVERVFEQLPDF